MTDSKIGVKNTVDNICPFCGAEYTPIPYPHGGEREAYRCGTKRGYIELWRGKMCYDHQIAALKERLQSLAAHAVLDEQEIAALKERLEAWKVYALAQKTAWDYTPTRQAFETIQQAEDRLKSLNEL